MGSYSRPSTRENTTVAEKGKIFKYSQTLIEEKEEFHF